MSKKSKSFYYKRFAGPDAFGTGLAELRTVCKPAHDTLAFAELRNIKLSALMDFVADVWPNQGPGDKVAACLLAMQAQLNPAAFPNVMFQASKDGLAYRTNTGTAFGWRRYKDGAYLFSVRISTYEPMKIYFDDTVKKLLEAGWKCGRFDKGNDGVYRVAISSFKPPKPKPQPVAKEKKPPAAQAEDYAI